MNDEIFLSQINKNEPKKTHFIKSIALGALLAFLFFIFGTTGSKFPEGKIVELENGETIRSFALKLKEEKVIFSSSLFVSAVVAFGGEKKAVAGPYFFEEKQSVFTVAKRVLGGDFDVKAVKITVPEGWNLRQIAERAQNTFPHFNTEKFITENKENEGYLFPDTYFFLPTATEEEVTTKMSETFEAKTKDLIPYEKGSKEYKDLIILASILEKEVRKPEDMKIVSGIFGNRLRIGMPLQADSTLAYVLSKDSLSLTLDDLKVSSPYNSYTRKGLPPTAIGNPGLVALDAALHPTKSDYLYFLTDKEGTAYYAKTFEGHKQNKQKYLK